MNDLKKEMNIEDYQNLEKERFQETLSRVFNQAFRLSNIEFEKLKLKHAKVNTNEVLNKTQMDAISFRANSWGLTYQISRSGSGIKIEFKIN